MKIYGNTEETRGMGKCGNETSQDFMPLPFQIKKTRLLYYWTQKAESLGLKKGLTYQIVPYDFRKSILCNQLKKNFRSNLERIHKLTGKKVLIVGHSYGVKNMYY